ncbi:MAG: hypothetical protein M3Y59_11380 [Myxococcota bacterium]|nr:hypothetical protein [Myxococcota bacterium]
MRGSVRGAVLWLLALAGAGCGSQLPDPRVLGVTPSTMLASEAREVVVRLEGVLPFTVDYDQGQASADRLTSLRIGGRELVTSGYRADGTIQAFIPSVLPVGDHDVTVRLGDQRSATAPSAFSVAMGNWPDGYQFEGTIPDQVVDQPFAVTIRALEGGLPFPAFNGTVNLTASRPEFPSLITQPFDAGLVTERTMTIPFTGAVSLTVTDTNGTSASSNTFLVRAP